MQKKQKKEHEERDDTLFTKDCFTHWGDMASIGRHTYGLPNVHHWGEGARLVIGSFTSIGEGVTILLGGNHSLEWITTYPFRAMSRTWPEARKTDAYAATRGDVVIGNDVWIGGGATILSGARIGDGAVVGARAVVARDVRPYAVVVGNPARERRRRFSDEEIAVLLAVRWWDWPEQEIKRHMRIICGSDVRRLAQVARTSAAPAPPDI